jgi:hypothetical protein
MKPKVIDQLKPFGFKIISRRAEKSGPDNRVLVSVYKSPYSDQRYLEFDVRELQAGDFLVSGRMDDIFAEHAEYIDGALLADAIDDKEVLEKIARFLSALADNSSLIPLIRAGMDQRALVSAKARSLLG